MSHLRLFLLSSFLLGTTVLPGQDPIFRPDHIFTPIEGNIGAISAAEQLAGEAGLEVLRSGGNAIDAGVCMGFTLAVTLPRAGNLGGGGFMLIHEAESGKTYALDYREVAPLAASRDMFLDESGNADPNLSRASPLAIGVPGTVAGLLAAHERFGSLPLADLMEPAIKLAREGIIVSEGLADDLQKAQTVSRLGVTAQAVYYGEDGVPPTPGERLIQTDLADSLERIKELGRDGFYSGPTAQAIVATVDDLQGAISLEDFANYTPVWREPVQGTYKEHTILSMPPPSSGGIHIIQMLKLLENFPLSRWGHNSGQSAHIMAEVMKRAYADRSQYLGDPDFADVPQEKLLSEAYEQLILEQINSMTPTASEDIQPGPLNEIPESPQTTHFSIVDKHGNAVSNTYTLNFTFGSGIMAEGTGILLNNEMDDFSAKPGVPNAYGLIGGDSNAIEPGKRPLSSMSPVIVLKDGAVRIVTGSPGGPRIINTVLQVLLNIIEFDMNAAEANSAPRFHHQWWPDTFQTERGFPSDAIRSLNLMGYTVEVGKVIGSAKTIIRNSDGRLSVAADPRRYGGTAIAF